MFILVLVVFWVFVAVAVSWSGGNITPSTVAREKLDGQYVTTTEYYADTIGWIRSGSKLKAGMKSFFDDTGVQPFLYLTETVNGSTCPSDEEMEAFANSLYDELFEDEGHLLVVFQEYNSDGNYLVWCVAGKQAKTVFDDEARDIFFDYLDHYYYSSYSEDEFFSKAFEDTGKRMMEKTTNPVVVIAVIIGVIAVALIAFSWWKRARAAKKEQAAETARILNTPIEKIGDKTLEDLEDKYE